MFVNQFTKNKKTFKETGDSRYIYRNEIDKDCFQHDMTFNEILMRFLWDFKYLAKRTASYKILRDKAFSIAKNAKHYAYQRDFASMVYNFFDKKSKGSGINNKNKQNEQSAKNFINQLLKNIWKQYLVCWFRSYTINK